jgi:hypothetical protein
MASSAEPGQTDELERRFAAFLAAVAAATGVAGDPDALAAAIRSRAMAALGTRGPEDADAPGPGARGTGDRTAADTPGPGARTTAGEGARDVAAVPSRASSLDRRERAALLGWIAFGRMGELAPGADVAATSRAWYDELRLPGAFAAGLRETGLDEAEAWSAADLVRVLLALARPSALGGRGRAADARLIDAWLASDAVRAAMGVNTWEGVEYLDRDRFADLLRWASRLEAVDAAADPTIEAPFVERLVAAAETAGFRVAALRALLAGPPRVPGGSGSPTSGSTAPSGPATRRRPDRPA